MSAKPVKSMGTMKVTESYQIDKEFECKHVYTTTEEDHPGVKMTMAQKAWNIAGPVKVLSESYFPKEFGDIYMTPTQSRKISQNADLPRLLLCNCVIRCIVPTNIWPRLPPKFPMVFLSISWSAN